MVDRGTFFHFWLVAGLHPVKRLFLNFDWTIFILSLGFTVFGVLMVYNASSANALRDFGDKFYFLKDQAKWAGLGIGMGFFISFFDYRRLFSLSPFMLLASIVLLVLVFIPGIGVQAYGASRWLDFRFFVMQPAEITKLAFIIYLAAWFSTKDKGRLFSFLVLSGTIVGLVLLQPDMGTAIILGALGLIMFFLADGKIWQVLALGAAMIPAAAVLAIVSPYRLKRLESFFDPEADPLGSSYHIRQSLIAVGSGGLFGLGLGNSRQKYSYLPEATTDSIFAIIAEELGLVGVLIFLGFMGYFLVKGMNLALAVSGDRFGQLLVGGVISWIAIQTVLNVGSTVALVPLTGVPLPFTSYGGSSLVAQWLGIGLVLSVSRITSRKNSQQ